MSEHMTPAHVDILDGNRPRLVTKKRFSIGIVRTAQEAFECARRSQLSSCIC